MAQDLPGTFPPSPPGVSQATVQAPHCLGALEAGLLATQSPSILASLVPPRPIYLSPKETLFHPEAESVA